MKNIRESVSLKNRTTFSIGGNAKYFAQATTKSELVEICKFAKENKLQVVALGGGSNVLINDDGIDGVVVSLTNKDVEIKLRKSSVLVTVGAGKNWEELVGEMVKKGYQGIECLSGIPGTTGAAPIQNIGAYGQEIKETFVSLTAYDTKLGKFKRFSKKECQFGYRDSVFKRKGNKGRYIVYQVTLRLKKINVPKIKYQSLTGYLEAKNIVNPTLSQVRCAVLAIRSEKLENPKIVCNSGSFFKNPIVKKTVLKKLLTLHPDIPNFPNTATTVKLSAGWLIDKAGWKGKKYKNVAVSTKHALVLTNPDKLGTAKEIKELAQKISLDVYDKFNVLLEPEVQFL
ncbi:UDP-N-acetylmuramate dehydrogenase [Candidatus Woesebacteria bacterium]|nr:MAG: UDP-N-acetylmuramate dehydrogenase [Candidatus Woesebacteria bacterium]